MTLTLSQRTLRDLRLVANRTFGSTKRSRPRRLQFRAGEQARLCIVENEQTLGHALPDSYADVEPFSVALDDLRPFESGRSVPVTIERSDATAMTDPHTLREGFRCLSLNGARRSLDATDSRKALQVSPVDWPWAQPLLVPRSRWIDFPAVRKAARGLAGFSVASNNSREQETSVCFKAGPWSLELPTQAHRFPDVARIVPRDETAQTVVTLDDTSHESLSDALKRLPRAVRAQPDAVTCDINERLTLRVSREDTPVEATVAGVRVSGEAVRVAIGRHVLHDVVRLGLGELRITGPGQPVWGSAGPVRYVAMPLHPDFAAASSTVGVRREYTPATAS